MKVETKEKLTKVAKISGFIVLGLAAAAGIFFGARYFVKNKTSEGSGDGSGSGDSQ
jgi:hypothetical protein